MIEETSSVHVDMIARDGAISEIKLYINRIKRVGKLVMAEFMSLCHQFFSRCMSHGEKQIYTISG